MKYSKILDIYNATEDLANKPFTNEQQWEIYKFRKALRPNKEFYEEREILINDKYIEFANEEGILQGKKYKEYLKEKEELGNTIVEFCYPVFKLPLVDGVNFKIIEQLEEFIEFYFEN